MKKLSLIIAGVAGLMLLAATPTFAADADKAPGSEKEKKAVTITGEAKCAKCSLKEADKCQTVIEVEGKNGKKATKYYVADNEMAKKLHGEVCKENKQMTATGTVKRVDGKREITLEKFEPAKKTTS